jgi:hypothetical protein
MRDKDPIVSALLFSSQMTLDLVWALEWCSSLDDEGLLKAFLRELETRRKDNHALDSCAKEVGL